VIGRQRNRRGLVAIVVSLTGVLSLSAGSLPWDRIGSPVAANSETAGAAALLSGVGSVAGGTHSAGSAAAEGGHQASGLSIQAGDAGVTISQPQLSGIKKIQHIVMIMQENRSFDHYFGTFPGADGIPMHMQNGTMVPIACVPTGMPPPAPACIKPYHDKGTLDAGGPHHWNDSIGDINGGAMDGFIKEAMSAKHRHQCQTLTDPECTPGTKISDVMGYKDWHEIPNYWKYAKQFVLQDKMFEPVSSWSLPAHLFMVSGWSAKCPTHDPLSCTNAPSQPYWQHNGLDPKPIYAWTDLTYLLHEHNVSWRYYVADGTPPDCPHEDLLCTPNSAQYPYTPSIWNPLPNFDTVIANNQVKNIQYMKQFFNAAANGNLPSVAWVIPNGRNSEHGPASLISDGQAFVTSVVNAVMKSPNWSSSAIFISWDDWGGFFDHVVPPVVDGNGYGIRVPGLVISPYAKTGFIDDQTLSFDAYLKFIEDVFLGGERIDPATDGRPDNRPTVRETPPFVSALEPFDLRKDFDFTQAPRPPVILNPRPHAIDWQRQYWRPWLSKGSPG
jgi:phospholipase C